MKQYKLRGINDDHNTCEVCGKTNLKKVMWLSEITEDGEVLDPFAAGTTCGAKLMAIKGSRQAKERKIEEMAYQQVYDSLGNFQRENCFIRQHRESTTQNAVPKEMFKMFCQVSLSEFIKARNEKYPIFNENLPISERIKYS